MPEVLTGAGGLALAADVAGPEDGTPVVLLHGGGQTRHSWAGTWRVLVDSGYRALSVDLRGHGDSAWPEDGDYSFDAFAEDVVAVAASLRSPPILIGASLGGLASPTAISEARPRWPGPWCWWTWPTASRRRAGTASASS